MRTNRFPIAMAILVCLLGVSAAAQNTLTAQEREAALQNFQTTRDNFLKSIAGLSQKQWTFEPGPDRWSVAEVASTSRYPSRLSSV